MYAPSIATRPLSPAWALAGLGCCCGEGLGDVASAEQGVQIGTALASSSLPAVAALAGPGASILGMSAAVAVPVIGAALAGVAIAAELLIKNSGCGQTCIVTSQWANQAEPILQNNLAAYFSNKVRTVSMQSAALANFDAVWSRLVQMCSDPSVGNAGKRCISDRQSGACTWKQRAGSPLLQYPGEPQPGACWNWFSGYRDPIANDAGVVPDTPGSDLQSLVSAVSSSAGQALQSVGVSSSYAVPLLLGLALLLGVSFL